MKIIIFLTLLLTLRSSSCESLNSEEKTNIGYKLPQHAWPVSYTIFLNTSLEDFTFQGTVKIDLQIKENARNITLHARDLMIKQAVLERSKTPITLTGIRQEIHSENDTLIYFVDSEELTKGTDYTLTITFTGKLNDDLAGFYRSSYLNDKNEKVWLATTQFEPVGARRAFPCFDEPIFKSKFSITLEHAAEYTAISNMPFEESSFTNGNRKTTSFYDTPIMSSYLVAFVISDFKQKSENNFVVLSRPDRINDTEYALVTGQKVLHELIQFTGIGFPIDKMQQIAIPDFKAGAMENWGLVTYRETALLFNNQTSSTLNKQNILEIIAHEFAHQWFGNLVSPTSWKYVWLNEGFATFFMHYIADKIEPSWRLIEQSVVNDIQSLAMIHDSGKKSRPLNKDVESPKEISNLFDRIAYQKGGAIIRMMQHFLTEDVFKQWLRNYLYNFSYKNADSNDLFSSLNPKNIKDTEDPHIYYDFTNVMNTWVDQPGYPLVTVKRKYGSVETEITQSPFVSNRPKLNQTSNSTWYIPINYATEENATFNNTLPRFWFEPTSKMMTKNISVKADHWIIFNVQQTGFYRVNYDDKNWELLIKYLNNPDGRYKNIHVLNRAQLIDDAAALVKTNKLKLDVLFNLTNYLKKETDFIAWHPAYRSFLWLKSKLIHTEYYQLFKDKIKETYSESLNNYFNSEETDKDEHLKKLHRTMYNDFICSLGDETCSKTAKNQLELWRKNKMIKPSTKYVYLCHGLKDADFETWNSVLKIYLNTTYQDEKAPLLQVLGCSANEEIVRYFLNYTLEDDTPLNSTSEVVEIVVERSEVGVNATLDFIVDRIVKLLIKNNDVNELGKYLQKIGEKITNQYQLNKLERIAANKDIPSEWTEEALRQAKENLEWVKNNAGYFLKPSSDQPPNDSGNGVGISGVESLKLIVSLLFAVFTFKYYII